MNARTTRPQRLLALLCAASLASPLPWSAAHAQTTNPLPSLGDPASEDLTVGDERRFGEMIMREIWRDPDYLDDPVLLEYVQTMWKRLLAASRASGNIPEDTEFRYAWEPFLVRDRNVNAFALPGGYVGVYLGMLALTDTPDELASVLAHELSHVTQRHIARSISNSKRASILNAASVLLAVLAASRTRSTDAAGAIMNSGQAAAIQTQLNFSRDAEREADRVGFQVLSQAGYAPGGMAAMFEKLDQSSRINDSGGFPYLRTHPLTVERIGEARARLGTASAVAPVSELEHAVMAARARVLMDTRAEWLRSLQGGDANTGKEATAGASVAQKLGAAYASAFASTLLRDWPRADAALAQATVLAQGSPRHDDRALRAVTLLKVESLLARGDLERAETALDPLLAETARPVLLLQAQIALAAAAQASAAGRPPAPWVMPALKKNAESLQTWVTTRPRDALAWGTLSQSWAKLDQPLRSLRADAEAHVAIGDLRGAVERLRAAQRLVRAGGQVDFIEASVIDSRVRDIEGRRRAELAEQKKSGGPAEPG